MHNEAGPRTPPPQIIRSYCAGSMCFARLMQHAVGTPEAAHGLYLKTDSVSLPVTSVEEADALIGQWVKDLPTAGGLHAPAPYENFGYAVCFRAVEVLAVAPLPPTPAPAPPVPAPVPAPTPGT